MADIINQITRNKTLGQIPQEWKDYADNLSPQDRQVLKQQIQQEIVARQSQENKSKLGNVLFNAGNRLREVGGKARIEDPEGKQDNSINDFIMKEMIKKQMREKPIAEIPQGETPPGLWRDPATGKIHKVPIIPAETVQDNNITPPVTDENVTTEEQLPEGLWRDPVSGKIYKLPNKADKPESVAQQKFNIEQEDKKKKAEQTSQFIKDSTLDTLNTIKNIEKNMGFFGLGGTLIPEIPGSPKADWNSELNKLLSGKVIDLMKQMKEASKTGATGFGQLSEKELAVLQEASTALKRNISPEKAQEILNTMKEKLQKIAGINQDERNQAKSILINKGYSEQEAEQMLGE